MRPMQDNLRHNFGSLRKVARIQAVEEIPIAPELAERRHRSDPVFIAALSPSHQLGVVFSDRIVGDRASKD
jgi:hypothetical protein